MPGTRKLGRPTAHRKAMLRGLVTYLLQNGKVETTVTRAKEVRALAEKMITLGKQNTLASRRAAYAFITSDEVVKKLFDALLARMESGRALDNSARRSIRSWLSAFCSRIRVFSFNSFSFPRSFR